MLKQCWARLLGLRHPRELLLPPTSCLEALTVMSSLVADISILRMGMTAFSPLRDSITFHTIVLVHEQSSSAQH